MVRLMASSDLTNAEIAGLRAYFRSSGFKYPAGIGDEMPPDWKETWQLIYFNALPRLLEEVLRRRFHAGKREIDLA